MMGSLNRKNNSYKNEGVTKIFRIVSEGIKIVGEGMVSQHDEDLMGKKSPQKKTH